MTIIDQDLKLQNKNESGSRPTFVFLLTFILLVVVDQAAKFFAFSRTGFFLPFKNFNFAFSLSVPVVAMYAIYAVVLMWVGSYFYKNYKTFSVGALIAWVLIFAGGISNILERIVLGYVRDFLYIWGGVFNLADMYILLGIGILVFKPLIDQLYDSKGIFRRGPRP